MAADRDDLVVSQEEKKTCYLESRLEQTLDSPKNTWAARSMFFLIWANPGLFCVFLLQGILQSMTLLFNNRLNISAS